MSTPTRVTAWAVYHGKLHSIGGTLRAKTVKLDDRILAFGCKENVPLASLHMTPEAAARAHYESCEAEVTSLQEALKEAEAARADAAQILDRVLTGRLPQEQG